MIWKGKYNSPWMPAIIISMGLHAAALTAFPEGVIFSPGLNRQNGPIELEVNAMPVSAPDGEPRAFDIITDSAPLEDEAGPGDYAQPHIENTSEIMIAKISAQEAPDIVKPQNPIVENTVIAEQEQPESVDLIDLVHTTKDLDDSLYRIYTEYYKRVREKIAENVEYPQSARKLGLAGRVYVQFIINPEGALEFIQVLKSANYDVLNFAALQSIRRAAPFDKYPELIPRKNFRFSIPIIYALE